MSTFTPQDQSQTPRSPALSFFVLAVVLSLLFSAYVVYLFVAQFSTKKEADVYVQETVQLQQQVNTLTQKKVGYLQKAKQVLDKIDSQRIYWSKVIHDALLVMPKDAKTGATKSDFLSYSGSSDGKLVMSMKTIAGSQGPYTDVADVVNAFSRSSVFRDVFVPTISKNQNDQGQAVLTYVLNLTYHGE